MISRFFKILFQQEAKPPILLLSPFTFVVTYYLLKLKTVDCMCSNLGLGLVCFVPVLYFFMYFASQLGHHT